MWIIILKYSSGNSSNGGGGGSGGSGGGDGRGGCSGGGGVYTFLCILPSKAKKVNQFPEMSCNYCNMLALGPRKLIQTIYICSTVFFF